MTTNLIAVVGSLRSGSVNAATARAAVGALPEGVAMSVLSVADVPLYNGDIEEAGLPDSVSALHTAVGAADGLVFFSPEYNGSFPAVTKNAIDWLSRPPRSWEGTALSMVVTSPGPRAGGSLRGHFSAIMEHQPIRLFEPMGIGSYGDKLDDSGEISDADTVTELGDFIARFAHFAASE